MKIFKFILPLFLGALLFSSCQEENISSNVRSNVRFNFINTETTKQEAISSVLTVTALGTDSILVNKESNAKHATLPLQYTATTTTYIFKFSETVKDTVWIEHENYPFYISMDAGVSMYYKIKGARCTTYLLDKVTITNANVNETEKENFQLYFTPAPTASE